ncbi:MAG TPA: hypothetical protein VFE47_29095 [Tepidisphaeraceae bacterium]|jgi:hypothetical protein|nr:hypothetical protein [Tepidisphaeraceae bacterium]
MNHHDGDMTDVFVVLEELTDTQTLEVAGVLEGMGMIVRKIDNDESVIEGSIDSQKVRELNKVKCVRCVRSGLSYAVDYPPGDPRNLDPPDDDCDESED